ncbi:cell division protein ZapA [Ideonella sp. A 288]|uniref:cell division protein ZapA n=1 Tax=Ideonella sp. A 288 TaxID=1962181 RepID=UPI000B4AC294|nr:cell division protein ZapA [Ideonella sp. A 288]
MKQIEATILGQSYALACPPGGEQLLREAVAIVDREMSGIRDAGKVKARERMAVLAALNLAYQRAEQSAAAALAPPPAPPMSTPPSTGVDFDIEQLIRRIDSALGDDGHLL